MVSNSVLLLEACETKGKVWAKMRERKAEGIHKLQREQRETAGYWGLVKEEEMCPDGMQVEVK